MTRNLLFLFTAFIALSAFTFAQGGGVKGKVRAPNGKGIPNATITLRLDGKEIRTASSDSKGDFTIIGITAGKYNLTFEANGYSLGVLHDVEVDSKVRDLGSRLVLSVDRGSFVIVQGGVFFKEGSSVTGASIKLEQINPDGSAKSLASTYTNTSGEFSFRRPEGSAKLRVTAKLKDASASKEIDVDDAAIYRLAITLPISRNDR
ncbi:MAG: carboxypeptidase-like regulatory domain-containing protein [Pyrinomonadaceae bacterium]